ncbi:hypothetical protein [Parapedobacter sp. 10938]|uniref:hypothetical protein n=1 Tax=Parapedobacter flavus TaxID=3110225 RepID=UPI002DB99207|nr:hypothetical protein [Parapedobacter sp. 10938]MEC3881827.1 hypothetical protein [Parapedobacter sp. 10938]
MEQYTWGQFWTVVVVFIVIYYGVVYLVYYLPKKKKVVEMNKDNNDSNNIKKSDNNIVIFDSPFISNFDNDDGGQEDYKIENKPEMVAEKGSGKTKETEFEEDNFDMVGFEEDDVIFDHVDYMDDDGKDGDNGKSGEEMVELEEDLYDVTWESYTPGEQINLDFDNSDNV